MAEKNLFFRRIFPLWFNSKLKKDCGFQKPNFPKIFFGLMKPGDHGNVLSNDVSYQNKLISCQLHRRSWFKKAAAYQVGRTAVAQ